MRYFFIALGFIFLGIGIVGVFMPVLPTTPFLLMTTYFFAKSSPKFHAWFIQTRLYEKHLKNFVETRSMTKRQKWSLMIFVDLVIISSIIIVNNLYVTIALVLIDLVKYWYFFTKVKTL
jgi:hypothetical protein